MRILRVLLLVSSSFALVLPLSTSAQSTDEQQIRSAENAIATAEGRGDLSPFKQLAANDWVTVTPDGRVLHKDEIIQNSIGHENELKPYVVKLSDMRVDVFGNTAVATFVREYHGRTGEANGRVARESVVDVFIRDGAKWKLHYGKAMPLPNVSSSQM